MHFEILVEDQSGAIALGHILEKILGTSGTDHSWRIHNFLGIGHLPKDLSPKTYSSKKLLLTRLPQLLQGYGKSLCNMDAAVIIVVDLDNNNCLEFKQQLMTVLQQCNPQPQALFRIAIEESEAWLLGDRYAVQRAYPKAKENILDEYEQDSICGTWEKLADAIYSGGAKELNKRGGPHTGRMKCEWADNIAPHINIETNRSRSFQVFRDGIRNLIDNN